MSDLAVARPWALAPWRRRLNGNGQLLAGAVLLTMFVLLAAFPAGFAGADPQDCPLSRSLDGPGPGHLFGFDLQGCDLRAVTIYGTRTSLGLAVVVIAATTAIALAVGSIAGYAGGRLDALLTQLTDVWSSIPLILGGVIVLSGSSARGFWQVALVLIVFGWPPMVRVLRASVLEIRARDYVTAAKALGARPFRILLRHVLPNALRPLIVFASAYAGVVIAAEATLTFAGVGLQRPTQSWGIQLFTAQDDIGRAPHLLVFPALFVVLAVVGCVLLGEGLRRRASTADR